MKQITNRFEKSLINHIHSLDLVIKIKDIGTNRIPIVVVTRHLILSMSSNGPHQLFVLLFTEIHHAVKAKCFNMHLLALWGNKLKILKSGWLIVIRSGINY